jgi:hypothetical protein
MMKKSQSITLTVTYYDDPASPFGPMQTPAEWNWSDLADEDVTVTAFGPLVEVDVPNED